MVKVLMQYYDEKRYVGTISNVINEDSIIYDPNLMYQLDVDIVMRVLTKNRWKYF
jgi:hypothetical protein